MTCVTACTVYQPEYRQHTPVLNPKARTYQPYVIKGIRYYPQRYYEYDQTGTASYYGENDGCQGALTATADRFNKNLLTAAHKTLPLPCVVRVTNLDNGRSITLKVNDRGPFAQGRILDVSVAAAQSLGFYRQGLARVRVRTLVPESLALVRQLRAQKKQRARTTISELCKRLW